MLCGGHDSRKCIWIAELRTLSFAKVVIGKKVYLGTGRNAAGQITQRKNVIRGIIGPRDDRGADPDITVRESSAIPRRLERILVFSFTCGADASPGLTSLTLIQKSIAVRSQR